jgi:hypothetical protein
MDISRKEIVVDGRTFEVLDLPGDSIDLEFVQLSTGVIAEASYNDPCDGSEFDSIYITLPDGSNDELWVNSLPHYGIIPLCEICEEPIEFTGVITQSWRRSDDVYITLSVPLDQIDETSFPLGNRKLTCRG